MKLSPKLRPSCWDALVVLAVAALAVLCALAVWGGAGADGGELTVVVSADGAEVERFPLSGAPAESDYTGHGYTLHVSFANGEVRVARADCPTQDCVHTGAISRPGQSIVCLPARIILQLERADGAGGGVDAVIG